MKRAITLTVTLSLFLGVGALAACGGDDDDGGNGEAAATKPEFDVPAGDPPTELQTEDLKEGSGAEAEAGTTVTIHYVGKAYSTREQFDASWDRGQPFSFALGANPPEVVPGFDQGVTGMKVGGRRQVVIPPDLGYGPNPPGAGIGVNDTLVFVIDLLEVS